MPIVETASGPLAYEVTDVSPRWYEPADTILFHHGIGTDMDIWAEWLPALAGDFRCVRLDMRGCGHSPVPGEGHDWSMAGLMEDVLAVADAVGAERFHLVGESIGGTICLFAARHAADRVESVTALSTGHRGGNIQQVGAWREMIESQGFQAWSDQMMEHRFYPDAVDDSVREWFAETQAASDADTTIALGELLVAQDLTNDLRGITCPVLLIHPDASPFLPVSISAEIHELLPNSRMMVIPGARHAIACSHAADCAMAFLEFVSEDDE